MVWRLSGECVQSNGIIFPMNDVKVSVCIVVYNSEKLIGRALESVLNQNLDSLEIVVVDDGSTDGSSGVIRYYAEKHSNIIAVYEENMGVSLARKNAVIHSHGDYIGFVDADDFVEPDMFRVMYESAEESGAEIVECRAERDGTLYNSYPHGVFTGEEILERYFLEYDLMAPLWLRLVRRNLYEGAFPEKRLNNEDNYVLPVILARCSRYIILPESDVFYHYTVDNPEGVMNSVSEICEKSYKKYLCITGVPAFIENNPGTDDALCRKKSFKIFSGRLYNMILMYKLKTLSYKECMNDIINMSGKDKKTVISDIIEYYRFHNRKGTVAFRVFGPALTRWIFIRI